MTIFMTRALVDDHNPSSQPTEQLIGLFLRKGRLPTLVSFYKPEYQGRLSVNEVYEEQDFNRTVHLSITSVSGLNREELAQLKEAGELTRTNGPWVEVFRLIPA